MSQSIPDYTPDMVKKSAEVLGHPRALFVLFFSEMWERFSYYGMRALLIFYMVEVLKYADEDAHGTYGAYIGFVYATPFIGGMLADKFLGARRAIVIGGVLMAFGHFVMAIEHTWFFYGAMALIITGNGFFKPNISTLVGSIYAKDDPRRDGAFTIFYMGINIGACLSPLACGWLGERLGYHYGFGLAGIGMVFGLIVFLRGQRLIGEAGLPPSPEALRSKAAIGIPKLWLLYIGILLFVPFAGYMLTRPDWVEQAVYYLGPLVVLWVTFEAMRCERDDRGRLLSLMVLIFFSIFFWSCFEQAGSSMNLFAMRHTDRTFMGWEIPASWFQSLNPAFIILLAIPFSWLWSRLGAAHRDPSSPLKFSLGLIQLGLGFIAMVMAAKEHTSDGAASMWWLVLAYFLHTTGELCLSPVGLSTVTRMAPLRLVGLMMGVWFLSNAFAGVLSGVIAKLTTGEAGYEDTFRMVVYLGIGAGIVLLILTPFLNWIGPDPKLVKAKEDKANAANAGA